MGTLISMSLPIKINPLGNSYSLFTWIIHVLITYFSLLLDYSINFVLECLVEFTNINVTITKSREELLPCLKINDTITLFNFEVIIINIYIIIKTN